MILMFRARKVGVLLSCIAFLLVSFHLLLKENSLNQTLLRPAGSGPSAITLRNREKQKHEFYGKVLKALEKFRPVAAGDLSKYRQDSCGLKDITYWTVGEENYQSYNKLDVCFKLGKDTISDLSSKHSEYIKYISSNLNLGPQDELFNTLFPNEKGVVTVGGGKYSILALTMIAALRNRGSSLPVEVFIPLTDAPEDSFCDYITKLNAKCIYQTNFFSDKSVTLTSYQTKSLALLACSFKHAIFIDADNIPMMTLDDSFDSDAYKEKGLILWPDLWVRLTAPVFYQIAGIDIDFSQRSRYLSDDLTPNTRYTDPEKINDFEFNKEELPMHDFENAVPNISSETGQIFVDKERHFLTLLLALYYNHYGTEWFYRMMSLETSGEGDKETFITAAHVLKKPYYQVKTPISLDGYWPDVGGFKGVGLIQHDFSVDYNLWKKAKKAVAVNIENSEKSASKYSYDTDFLKAYFKSGKPEEAPAMFVHASYHKFVPIDLYEEKVYIGKDGKQFRSFKSSMILQNFDLELFAFENLQKHICIDKDIEFRYMTEKVGADPEKFLHMCKYMEDRVTMLRETHDEVTNNVS